MRLLSGLSLAGLKKGMKEQAAKIARLEEEMEKQAAENAKQAAENAV